MSWDGLWEKTATSTWSSTTSARNCAAAPMSAVAGSWQHLTRRVYPDAIWTATGRGADNERGSKPLSQSEALVPMCVAYFQPITCGELFPSSARKRLLIRRPKKQGMPPKRMITV